MYHYDYVPPALKAVRLSATHATELFPVFGYGLRALGGGRVLRASATGAGALAAPGALRHAAAFLAGGRSRRATLVIDARDRVELDPRGNRRRAWEGYAAR